jgi:hypothetical protein
MEDLKVGVSSIPRARTGSKTEKIIRLLAAGRTRFDQVSGEVVGHQATELGRPNEINRADA